MGGNICSTKYKMLEYLKLCISEVVQEVTSYLSSLDVRALVAHSLREVPREVTLTKIEGDRYSLTLDKVNACGTSGNEGLIGRDQLFSFSHNPEN